MAFREFATLSLVGAMACAPALAQQAASTGDGLEVIVVTALKREASVLKVPDAITVLAGDELKTQGVNTLSDIQNVVPSVNIATGRDGVPVGIRGVVTTDTSSKGEQDIGFNVDGVYVGRGNARGAAFFDIDRIEVLRGPQGTLYGRSSTGGAINVITKAPVIGESSGYLRAEYGNYNAKRSEGAINIPLGGAVALRLSGAFNDRDGYSTPIAYSPVLNNATYNFAAGSGTARNDQVDAAGRASLLVKPGDGFSLRLTATLGNQGGTGSASALETQLAANGDSGGGALAILANPVRAYVDSHFATFDGHLNARLGGNSQLDVVASYQSLDHRQQGPSVQDASANGGYSNVRAPCLVLCGGSFGPAFDFFLQKNHVTTTQGEARISNVADARLDYVAGVNYFVEKAGENGQSWNAPIDTPLDTSTYVFQAGPINTTTHKAYGVFGQATWHVSDQIGVVGGLRYTHNEIARDGRFALPYNFPGGFPFGAYPDVAGNAICTYPNDCIGNPNIGGSSDSKVTYRVGLNYQFDPSNLFYAAIASGFKGGTFNDYDPATGGAGSVGPSSLVAYEVGYKGLPVRNFSLSSSLFYYDFTANQVTGGVQFPNNGPFVIYTAVTPTKTYGWENELSYRIARQTQLSASIALLHSEFVDFMGGVNQNVPFKGAPLDLTPTSTASVGLSHGISLGDRTVLRLRGAVRYSNGYWISDFGSGARYWQPSFTRSDASVSIERNEGQYELQLFVENIENKVQRTGNLQGYAGPSATTRGPLTIVSATSPANNLAFSVSTPQFYGIRLSARF